ncbi:MAG: DnaJ domain-containing protein [Beijerinckiaceae bacterium]
MADLYEVLGVPRDATTAAIRRAFRKKARAAHPDGGGSAEAFNELKTAYDVLADPVRRKRYDETGELGDAAPDPQRARLVEMLSVGLDLALLRLSQAPALLNNFNIVQLTAESLRTKQAEWREQKRQYEAALTATRRLEERFSVTEGDNLMELVVEKRIAACKTNIDLLAKNLALAEEALKVLEKTSYRRSAELIDANALNFRYLDSNPTVF